MDHHFTNTWQPPMTPASYSADSHHHPDPHQPQQLTISNAGSWTLTNEVDHSTQARDPGIQQHIPPHVATPVIDADPANVNFASNHGFATFAVTQNREVDKISPAGPVFTSTNTPEPVVSDSASGNRFDAFAAFASVRNREIDQFSQLNPVPTSATSGPVIGDSAPIENVETPAQAPNRQIEPAQPHTSTSAKLLGTGIAKGTGPILGPESPHRPRPTVNYNLKDLASKIPGTPEEASHPAEERPDSQFFQDPVQSTSIEEPPAKRQRLDGYSTSPLTSPDSMGPGDIANTRFASQDLSNIPEYFNRELLKDLLPTLLDGGLTDPIDLLRLEFFRSFIALPKARNLEWNPNIERAKWSYRTKVDVIALLVQMTGIPAPQCCTKCIPQVGLFIGCIVTKYDEQASRYYGCANCIYHGTQTYCNLKAWGKRRSGRDDAEDEADFAVVNKPKQPESHYARYSFGQPDEKKPWESTSATKVPPTSQARWEAQAAPPRTQAPSGRQVLYTSVASTKDEASKLAEIPSMERWERAPGRIRSQARGRPENIAFSKSYLTSGVDVAVCRDATFKIELIRSGHTHSFKAENSVTRICSIASSSGKLTVKMDGESPIVIGPHGLFVVRPGSTCLVESEVYDEVALHITSVRNG